MTKEELLDYINSIIEGLHLYQESLINIRFAELATVRDNINKVVDDANALKEIDLEKINGYIKIPEDVLNVIIFYQLILQSSSYILEYRQIVYLQYLFGELKKIIDEKYQEEIMSDSSVVNVYKQINCLKEVIENLEFVDRISLEDYIAFVKQIKQTEELGDYRDDLLQKLSSHIRFTMVGNDYQKLDGARREK